MHTSNQATESYRDPSYVAVKKKSRQRRRRAEEAFTASTPSVLNATKMSYSSLTYRVTARNKRTTHNFQIFLLTPNQQITRHTAHQKKIKCWKIFGKSIVPLVVRRGFSYRIGKSTLLCARKEEEGRKKGERRKKERSGGGRTARI